MTITHFRVITLETTYLFLKQKSCQIALYIIFGREVTPRHWGFLPISSGRKVGKWGRGGLTRVLLGSGPEYFKKAQSFPLPLALGKWAHACSPPLLRNTVYDGKGHSRVSYAKLRFCSASPKPPWGWWPKFITSSSSPAYLAFFWSYSKLHLPLAGTKEEGLCVWKISHLKLELRKT